MDIAAPVQHPCARCHFARAEESRSLSRQLGIICELAGSLTQAIGFPSRWISGFLAAILSNTLVSDVVPYMGKLPMPLSERDRRVCARNVNLVPWHADLENILVIEYESLPFSVILPSAFATTDQDIGLFSVYAPFDNFEFATKGNSYNVFFPVVSLLFFKPGGAFPEPDYGADRVIDILEGKLGASGTIQIMTVVEHFNMHQDIIRWKMSKE